MVLLQTRSESPLSGTIVETDVPARLDRLPWGRFHTLVVAALGITWILDGLEVTLVGAVAGALKQSPVLQFTNTDIGLASSAYLAGAVLGALFFGWLTDRHRPQEAVLRHPDRLSRWPRPPRRSPGISGASCVFRFLTGAGIGGEYTAINSTIQELIPARVRGWTDLAINGSFWVGAAHRRGGIDCAAQPGAVAGRHRLARGLRHRRAAQRRHLRDAHVDSREPALAGHARPAPTRRRRSWPASRPACAGRDTR